MNMLSVLFFSFSSLFACGDKDDGDDSGVPGECSPSEIACEDALFTDLSLQDDEVSEGEVFTTTEGVDFVTGVDATAGGYNSASQNPWVYVRFTESGAEKVEIDDSAALEDMSWDLALRRYIVRVNGGASGPGCVGALPLREQVYADITALPDGLQDSDFQSDDFYTEDCTLIEDTSGLEGSPNVILGQWWTYPGCVATSYVPFLLRTSEGRTIKMVIEQYYEEGQEDCNDGITTGLGESAIYKIRWQMLD